jgi:hypothetical protein
MDEGRRPIIEFYGDKSILTILHLSGNCSPFKKMFHKATYALDHFRACRRIFIVMDSEDLGERRRPKEAITAMKEPWV